jgi:hypothetical protein
MQAMFWRGRLAVFGGGASVEGKKLGWLFAMMPSRGASVTGVDRDRVCGSHVRRSSEDSSPAQAGLFLHLLCRPIELPHGRVSGCDRRGSEGQRSTASKADIHV